MTDETDRREEFRDELCAALEAFNGHPPTDETRAAIAARARSVALKYPDCLLADFVEMLASQLFPRTRMQ